MKRILVAYDGGEPARRALDVAADLAERFEAQISVISVVPYHAGRIAADPWDDATLHGQALDEARALLAERGMAADLLEPIGDPAATIERIAEKGGFDTVVIGSRGLGPVSRLFQGSVSGHVATHAKATVIVAR